MKRKVAWRNVFKIVVYTAVLIAFVVSFFDGLEKEDKIYQEKVRQHAETYQDIVNKKGGR